jgi:hypothetical protein
MKTLLIKLSLLVSTAFLFSFGKAQDQGWPRVIVASDGTVIKVYEPEPESFAGNKLKFRSAISVTSNQGGDPVFGTFWADSKVETDRNNRQVSVESLNITDIKIPAETDQSRVDYIRTTLESQIPQTMGPISLDQILSSLDQNLEQARQSGNISTRPPKIIYTTSPSILVIIDGQPKLQRNNDWGVDVVVNSPFTILQNTDGQFYLYGAHHWYTAQSPTGPYSLAGPTVPQNLSNIEASLDKNNPNNNASPVQQPVSGANGPEEVIPNIVVSTVPAELIQSSGEPNFSPIDGTSLLYMKNSSNDIFMDVNSQQYYVLISGRWYHTGNLRSNQWEFVPADKLPADFAKIPEGSTKDNVLASVAGTDAAKEAVMDAQIPQTAKVDRNTATTEVTYNGDPQFEPVRGTHMEYAVNTLSTVLRYNGRYYVVDNGVWFESDNPYGPWMVSTERPDEVDMIPPDNPDYNAKYVNIYDVTPDYVYMGYTPGYLNSYVYGPTVVYGTGYYYNPWYGPYYYPRPWSWGFNFGYNPWYGWSFGFGYSYGWFNIGIGWGGWHGGWWGPPVYHPAFYGYGWHGGYHPYGGFYGRSVTVNRTYINRVTINNNIYRNRTGVLTRENSRYAAARPASSRPLNSNPGNGYGRQNVNGQAGYSRNNSQAGTNRAPYQSSNIYSDRQGNVYQRGSQGQWQQRANRQWSPLSTVQHPEVVNSLNRQSQMRDRGQVRTQNFQSARPAPAQRSFGGGGGGSRPSGGGGRPSGGGGGGHRH